MYDQYIGVIQALGFNFVPAEWGYCGGALVGIGQNQSLFSLIGCQFGGDCRTSFALPDLRGRPAMGFGNGPGLTPRFIGQMVGWFHHPLDQSHMATHSHGFSYNGGDAGTDVAVHVAQAAGNKDTPETGDYIAAPANALGAIAEKLYIAEADVPPGAQTLIGGVSGGGGDFINENLVIGSTPAATQFVEITQPSLVVNYCICMFGLYPSRS